MSDKVNEFSLLNVDGSAILIGIILPVINFLYLYTIIEQRDNIPGGIKKIYIIIPEIINYLICLYFNVNLVLKNYRIPFLNGSGKIINLYFYIIVSLVPAVFLSIIVREFENIINDDSFGSSNSNVNNDIIFYFFNTISISLHKDESNNEIYALKTKGISKNNRKSKTRSINIIDGDSLQYYDIESSLNLRTARDNSKNYFVLLEKSSEGSSEGSSDDLINIVSNESSIITDAVITTDEIISGEITQTITQTITQINDTDYFLLHIILTGEVNNIEIVTSSIIKYLYNNYNKNQPFKLAYDNTNYPTDLVTEIEKLVNIDNDDYDNNDYDNNDYDDDNDSNRSKRFWIENKIFGRICQLSLTMYLYFTYLSSLNPLERIIPTTATISLLLFYNYLGYDYIIDDYNRYTPPQIFKRIRFINSLFFILRYIIPFAFNMGIIYLQQKIFNVGYSINNITLQIEILIFWVFATFINQNSQIQNFFNSPFSSLPCIESSEDNWFNFEVWKNSDYRIKRKPYILDFTLLVSYYLIYWFSYKFIIDNNNVFKISTNIKLYFILILIYILIPTISGLIFFIPTIPFNIPLINFKNQWKQRFNLLIVRDCYNWSNIENNVKLLAPPVILISITFSVLIYLIINPKYVTFS